MGFERCHPAVNLIFFAVVIAGTLVFRHPVFLAISFVCGCCYSIWRKGAKAVFFNLCMLPCAAAYAVYYAAFHHFGVTVLQQNFVGNNMTVESLVYGLVLGLALTGACIWMSCVYCIFSSDKVGYLLGRVSPRLSLFLAIALRMVPRIQGQARKINTAQQGIGRGLQQGGPWQSVKNSAAIVSMVITWTIDSLITASEAMRCRGSTLRGRTAFSKYRFDNRDRALVIGLFLGITVTMVAWLLGATDMVYAPKMLWKQISWGDILFYTGYAALCMIPLGLEIGVAYAFSKARSRVL